jgi:hypothetical protein
MYVYILSRSIGHWIPEIKHFSKVPFLNSILLILIRLCPSVRTNFIPATLFMATTLLMGHTHTHTHMHKQEITWSLRWSNFHANG